MMPKIGKSTAPRGPGSASMSSRSHAMVATPTASSGANDAMAAAAMASPPPPVATSSVPTALVQNVTAAMLTVDLGLMALVARAR